MNPGFYNFTTSIIREPIPFSEKRRFWDFSSLVEAFVLSDEIYYWNTGAYNFEWNDGYYTVPENRPSIHPYEIFHGFDFINETPFGGIRKEERLIALVDKDVYSKPNFDKPAFEKTFTDNNIISRYPSYPYIEWEDGIGKWKRFDNIRY